jgi:hypothetical protein
MRRILRALIGMVLLPAAMYAGGGREIITNVADGLDIWQPEFDVSEKKKGTYNIIINAYDAAGNVGVSGPFNLKVNPLAGLPEARVVYPEQGQIVREDVSIVGVASGRYGIKEILVRIDNEPYQSLEGKEYWNLFVPAMDLVEGNHTIYVKAVDTMDVMGPETKINFILDIEPPAIELVSHEIGDLVAGSVRIRGKVFDANGLRTLSLSTDGETFTKLSTSKKMGDDARYFQFPIRSKKFEDGPLVYYLRAVNKTGRSVTRPFLFFVNNYPPQIEILSPQPGEDTYGNTQVTGRVVTGIGLTEFYYEWAGERHDIPLRPGDRFWTVTFPISMANNRAIPFRVTAVDKAGNASTVTQRFQDTRRNRVPAMVVDYPAMPSGLSRMDLEWDQPVYGHILPGFFPYAIMIEGEIEYVMAQPVFRIDPLLIPEGRNTMRLWAIDETDVTGAAFTLRINKGFRPEGVEFSESPLTISSPEEYDWFGDSVTVRGSIDGYKAGHALEYRLKWDDSWKPVTVNARGTFTATISLADLPEGAVPMEFRTVRDGQADYPLFLPVNRFTTLPEIKFLVPDVKYGTIHGDVTTAGAVSYFVPLTEISYSVDGLTFERLDFTAKYNRAMFASSFDYSAMYYNGQKLVIRAVDRGGNRVEASPEIDFDNSDDFPTVILNSPLEDELVTGDLSISGLAYDDDGISMLYWRILSPRNPWDAVTVTVGRNRNAEYNQFETEQNFLITVPLYEMTDGENVLQVFAKDIYGVECEVIQRVFKVSTAPPFTQVVEPAMDIWNRGNILVSGTSFDYNGIADILVSMDNGVSYQKADFASSQTEASPWSIVLNTKAYSDGIYSMLVRTVDKYGVSSFSNGIINIDNTPPDIDLGSPRNGDKIGVTLSISGQVNDNIALTRTSIELVNVENPNVRRAFDLPSDFVVMEAVDVSAFPDGDYTLKVASYDQSGNETSVIRNFNILKARAASEIALINPLPGIMHCGKVIVSGKITGAVVPETVALMLNRRFYADVEVNRYGIFRLEMPEGDVIPNAPIIFSAYFMTPNGERIQSFEHVVQINNSGPVLEIDSHVDGDVIARRPWISGRAFFVLPAPPVLEQVAVVTGAEGEAAEAEPPPAPKPSRWNRRSRLDEDEYIPMARMVELSFDNGRSFSMARGAEEWRFRLETGELARGSLPVVIKATFDDGSIAVRRILLTVDTRNPQVHTIGPPENSSHRTAVMVYGSASDDFDMDRVEVSLRPGDKAGYEVPGFIQGLYFDSSFLGGLNYSVGMGLTFFDDNVKVQFNAAQAPEGSRYSGWAFGGKILANMYTKNLSEWFGPDWEFYTTSLVLGAHFSYFWGMEAEGEDPLWMGQFLGQWEIIKADMGFFFPKWKYFKSISLYAEPGIWFAPSDVDEALGGKAAWRTKFTIAFGGRISLF